MKDSTFIVLCFSGAAVCAGIAALYWRATRESARFARMAEHDKDKLDHAYGHIHRNTTLGRGAGSIVKRAEAEGDSAAPHVPVIEVKPRLIRVCPPTVKMMSERKEQP